MSLRTLPEARTFQGPKNLSWDPPADVLAKWAASPMAADATDDTTITMFEQIGEDFWTGGGVTAKRISAALRNIGDRDVLVKINSPGGDLFEGIAIYNLLRKHKAKVTVEIVGMAASAASIIAMAGDEIKMGLGTFMMVHNAWGLVVGNRHDMREVADLFEAFDSAIADIYEARTGRKRADIDKLMDKETFMDPKRAVDEKFADSVDAGIETAPDDKKTSDKKAAGKNQAIQARRHVEAALAKAGFSRADRSELIAEISTAPRDAGRTTPAARDAGDFEAGVRQLITTMKG